MLKALGTLPWVEQDTIKMDFDAQELCFGISDKDRFNKAAVIEALQKARFPDAELKAGP